MLASQQNSNRRRVLAGGGALVLGLLAGCIAAPQETLAASTPPVNKPALFLIGDSTIRNGYWDNGSTNGQFGWGRPFRYHFDADRIEVVNDAMGGTSSRTYQISPELWIKVKQMIHPGDFVLMAFGHNDGPSSLPGVGEETSAIDPPSHDAPGGEIRHTFGWYMRNYVRDVRELGAEPIILSLIPRNIWTGDDEKIRTSPDGYAAWAKQVAEEEGAAFIPLNTLLASRWSAMGKDDVTARLFPEKEYVHPNWAGAADIADVVAQALRGMDIPLSAYLLENPRVPTEPDITPAEHGAPGPQGMLPSSRTPRRQ